MILRLGDKEENSLADKVDFFNDPLPEFDIVGPNTFVKEIEIETKKIKGIIEKLKKTDT